MHTKFWWGNAWKYETKSVNIKTDKLKVPVLKYAQPREMAVQFPALNSVFDEGHLVTFRPRPLYPLGEEPPVSN
jgi:hypothetical protein